MASIFSLLELIITQLADDTTLFLKNENQVSVAINTISQFSKASVLRLNLIKCGFFSKDCSETSICGIPVKNEVVYLGITIAKDQQILSKVLKKG